MVAENIAAFCQNSPHAIVTFTLTHPTICNLEYSNDCLKSVTRALRESEYNGYSVTHISKRGIPHHHVTLDTGSDVHIYQEPNNHAATADSVFLAREGSMAITQPQGSVALAPAFREARTRISRIARDFGFGGSLGFQPLYGDGVAWGKYLARGKVEFSEWLRVQGSGRFRAIRTFGDIKCRRLRTSDFKLNGIGQRRWRQAMTKLADIAGIAEGNTEEFRNLLGNRWAHKIALFFEDFSQRFGGVTKWENSAVLTAWSELLTVSQPGRFRAPAIGPFS